MITRYHGKNVSIQQLRDACEIGKDGVSLLGIAQAAEKISLHSLAVKTTYHKLIHEAPLPCVIHWNQNHFVVVMPQSSNKGILNNLFKSKNKTSISVADPSVGIVN
jgi:ATP-binding cassette subfamily B protein